MLATGPQQLGSIPASAGEPIERGPCPPPARVYPRECGGTHGAVLRPDVSLGLSPRVRGNRINFTVVSGLSRSIPASAGEPVGNRPVTHSWEVYPRECGGTGLLDPPHSSRHGLSPRVRGNPEAELAAAAKERSIPASAGEPSAGRGAGSSPRVYPRECGGTNDQDLVLRVSTGLSPRVRGTGSASGSDA